MPVLVALLRGINVGRHHRVAMADLRALLTDLGHTDVRTHLNSGNVVFSSRRRSTAAIGQEIEAALAAELSLPVRVVMRTSQDLAGVVADDPFAGVAVDGSRYLVTFLSEQPATPAADGIDPAAHLPDRFHVAPREIYLWCPRGLLESALPDAFSEARLAVTTTTRNWNTVTRLLELTQ